MSTWYHRNKEEQLRRNKEAKAANPEQWKAWSRASYHRRKNDPHNIIGHLLRHAKARAKAKNIPFELEPKDILLPAHCPILGVPLEGVGKDNRHSYSIDRIVPSKGYVKDNIQIISTLANRMKWDSSREELELFCKGMLKFLEKGEALDC